MSEKAIAKKIQEVEVLTERMKNADSFVVVKYAGLTVEQVTKLRRSLLEAGCDLSVIKNNITKNINENIGKMNELISEEVKLPQRRLSTLSKKDF